MYEPSGAYPWNLRVPVWGGGCVRPPLWGCRQAALCFGPPPFLPAIARTIKIAEISAGSLVFPGKYWYLQYNCVAWTPCHMQAERGMVPVNPPKIRTSTEEEA